MAKISCVDLFCGAGGLTHGFVLEGVPVVAGIDMDPACRFPYEANNSAKFVERDISKVTTDELNQLFGDADLKILAGCAPCQPFSTYAQRYELDGKDGKWGLLYEFARLAKGTRPDVITMENVPTVAKHEVFHDFVDTLKRLGYNVWFDVVDSSQYGVPQTRRRFVFVAFRGKFSPFFDFPAPERPVINTGMPWVAVKLIALKPTIACGILAAS